MATENRCGELTATGLVCNERAGHKGAHRGPRPSNMAGMPGHVAGSTARKARVAGPTVTTFRIHVTHLEFGEPFTIDGATWYVADGLPGTDDPNQCVEEATLAGTTLYAVQCQNIAKPVVTMEDTVTVAYLRLPGQEDRAEWDGRAILPAATDQPAEDAPKPEATDGYAEPQDKAGPLAPNVPGDLI